MAARKPRLCCAEAGGMGPCAEPRRDDSYFCDRHDQEWIERWQREPQQLAFDEVVA